VAAAVQSPWLPQTERGGLGVHVPGLVPLQVLHSPTVPVPQFGDPQQAPSTQ
jgi:hypothetical protein